MQLIYPLRNQAKTDTEKLHDYLLERNPEGVKKVLLLNGYQRFSSRDDMGMAMLQLVRQKGEQAISQLVAEHPDYELIVADYKSKQPQVSNEPKPVESKPAAPVMPATVSLDFSAMIQLLMFLACLWLVLKIFKD